MQIYTQQDMECIRSNMAKNPLYLERIRRTTANVRKKQYIQETGLGTWYHYFVCPACGVRLTFDYDNNETFVCPNCGRVQSGEPYLGAWWETVLCMTTSAAYELAIAYVGTGERTYFDIAKRILLGYADHYDTYEVHGGNTFRGHAEIYEYAYAYFGNEELLPFLAACYGEGARREESLVAMLYGAASIPAHIPELEKKTYLSTCGSNLAMLYGSDDRYLLFKAMPYGEEHDHYDRLAISFDAFGAQACVDLGTASGYGSPLHYGYYKNTASHNTVVINGENMAPCDTVVNEYTLHAPDDIYLDAETLPPEDYEMLDSFTIKQWSDEAYRGVRMRRILSWHDKYFIDVFSVRSDHDLKKEWTLHIDAETFFTIS